MAIAPGVTRAIVVDVADPEHRRRIRVSAPALWGTGERWALPCSAPGSSGVPRKGSTVWIAFEGGDRDMPVWLGILD